MEAIRVLRAVKALVWRELSGSLFLAPVHGRVATTRDGRAQTQVGVSGLWLIEPLPARDPCHPAAMGAGGPSTRLQKLKTVATEATAT